ncbi:MAG: formyltetrahydrofolate deformylase [Epsilonproteobacteria bacterium]|nr:formyltetrahydrofolate deformylase [Campylobacterota bacterium]
MSQYVLKIDCSDEKGLIYKISNVIFNNDLNIEKNSEFVDEESQKFFFRARVVGNLDIDEMRKQLSAVLPNDAQVYLGVRRAKNVVLMATKESHCLGDILLKYQSGELNANIQAVISNHDSLRALTEKFDIPYFYVSAENLERSAHEEKILTLLAEFNPDFVVLAKYMRILSADFVKPYEGKIINIHHSFLPAFIGANPYKQAHKRGVKIIGATAHFVNNDLDEGPIIAQDVIHVNHEYSWRDMQKAGRNVEKVVLSNAIDLAFEDRIFVNNNKTIIF